MESARALVEELVGEDESQRPARLARLSADSARRLAWALKDACYGAWSSQPQRARQASAVLAELASLHARDAEIEALAAWTAGIAALTAGDLERCIERLDVARDGFEQLGRTVTAAETRIARLIPLSLLGRHDEAVACAESAHAVFEREGEQASAAKVELNLGSMQLRRDAYAEAERWYRLASARFARLGSHEHSVMSDIGVGDALALRNRFDEAAHMYARARMRADRHGYAVLEAVVLGSMGLLDLQRGRFDEALSTLEASRRAYERLQIPHRLAAAEQNLADAYAEVNLLPEAFALLESVSAKFTALGMPVELAWAQLQRGRVLAASGDVHGARDALDAALAAFEGQGNAIGSAVATLRLAEIEADAAPRRIELLEHSLATFERERIPAWSTLARCLLGDASLARGAPDSAAERFAAAGADAAARGLRAIEARCHAGVGRSALLLGEVSRATESFERAAAMHETMRDALPGDEIPAAYAADKLEPFVALLRLALGDRGAAGPRRAFDAMERTRARVLLASIGMPPAESDAEVEHLEARLRALHRRLARPFETAIRADALVDEARTLEEMLLEAERRSVLASGRRIRGATPHATATTLQASLDPETAVVAYFQLEDELVASVVTADAIAVVRGMPGRDAVRNAVAQLRFQLDALRFGAARLARHEPLLHRRVDAHLERLSELVFRRVEAQLPPVRRVVVLPHDALHYVPFAALRSGGAPLLERYELSMAPSAAVWLECRARAERTFRRALIVAPTDARLSELEREATAVAVHFRSSVVLRGADANVARLRAEAADADVLHIACHGEFRADCPQFSALILGEERLSVRDVQRLRLRASLVTLSACDTGVNLVRPGDELLGFSQALFRGGASTLVTSAWAVDDATTADLMGRFYREVARGAGPAAALRIAQREIAALRPHPHYWAAFAVSGAA